MSILTLLQLRLLIKKNKTIDLVYIKWEDLSIFLEYNLTPQLPGFSLFLDRS